MKSTFFKLLISTLPLLSACSVLKNISKKSSESKLSEEFSLKKDSSHYRALNFEKTITLKDSVDDELFAEIIPVGVFSYSPENGFRGKASAIRVLKKSKRVKQVKGNKKSSSLTRERHQLEKKEKIRSAHFSETQDKQLKKKSAAWMWCLGIGMTLVFFLARFGQRIYK